MTMTPDERAKALFLDISRKGRLAVTGSPIEAEVVALIASAIREAENEALERAAAFLISETQPKPGESISVGDELLMHGAWWSAERIRSLKSKD